ncbi:glycosyltransferase [Priestia megaterium]|uniref:glycosyltransferase n=1 Tax=Priestia megaterium TaxID=1404 RepID=UPI00390C5D35
MNILYINNDMGISGSPKAILTEVVELKKRGHKVVVVSRYGELVEDLKSNNIIHYEVDLPIMGKAQIINNSKITLSENLRFFKNLFQKNRFFNSYFKLKKIILEEEIDIIQAHQPGPSLVGYFAAKKMSCPLVIRVQHILRNEFPSPFYRKIVRYASQVSVITEEVRDYMINIYNIKSSKIKIIPTLVDFQGSAPLIDRNNQRNCQGKIKLLTVTTLGSAKYQSVLNLIQAVQKLHDSGNECELTIVGDGDFRTHIEKEIKKNNQEGYIKMMGAQKDVTPFYDTTDVVVGVGRVAMEALYYGKLLICCSHFSYAGIFSEENASAISAYNFSGRNYPGDSLDYLNIYKDLERFSKLSQHEYESMSKFNKAFFEEKFRAEQIGEDTEKLFLSYNTNNQVSFK